MTSPANRFRAVIAEHIAGPKGQHIIGVLPTVDDPGVPFYYTIGNAERGLPELLLIGALDFNFAAWLLNELAARQRSLERPFHDGELVDLGGKFHPKIRRPTTETVRSEWTVQAGEYYARQDYDVRQVLVCDPQGVYPGEQGIDPKYIVPLA